MKKIILASIASAMMATTALAGVDLSGMSFDELLEVQKEVNTAIWESDGWQEVTVPIGVYKIGEEIPAGEWILTYGGSFTNFAVYRDFTNGELEHIITYGGLEASKDEEAKVILEEGTWLEVATNPVVFKPYVTSFSFK